MSPHGGAHLGLNCPPRFCSLLVISTIEQGDERSIQRVLVVPGWNAAVEGPLKEVQGKVPESERGQQKLIVAFFALQDRDMNPVLSQHLADRLLGVAEDRPPVQRCDLKRCWPAEVRRKQILGEHDGVIDVWANGQDEPDGYSMQAGSEVPTNGLGHRTRATSQETGEM